MRSNEIRNSNVSAASSQHPRSNSRLSSTRPSRRLPFSIPLLRPRLVHCSHCPRIPSRQRHRNSNRRPTRREFVRDDRRQSRRGVRHRSPRLPNPRRGRSSSLRRRRLRIGIRKRNSLARPNKDVRRSLRRPRRSGRRRRLRVRRRSRDGRRMVHERRRAR